jgi:hypothetical protein
VDNGISGTNLGNEAVDGASVNFEVVELDWLATCVSTAVSLYAHKSYSICFSFALKLFCGSYRLQIHMD